MSRRCSSGSTSIFFSCIFWKGCQMNLFKFTILVLVFLCAHICAAQVAYFEDFESFDAGTDLHNVAGWEGWYDSAGASAPVSDKYAFSGTKSIEVVSSADVVQVLDFTEGKWVLTAMQYIPSGTNGVSRFHMQNQYQNGAIGRSVQWSFSLADGVIGDDYDENASASIIYDEWIELKLIIDLDNDLLDQYYNGELFSSRAWVFSGSSQIQSIDLYGNGASSVYYDDIKIQDFLSSLILAYDPSPESEITDVPRDVVLQWTSGRLAETHDVYFGTSADDVTNAERDAPLDVLLSQGQNEATFDPEGLLDFSGTYYWRVDEVNGAPDHDIFRGEVWSFTAEPFAYPIQGVMATASSSHSADMGPEKTVDGSGLNELDQHSTEATDMWLSGMGDLTPSIQYEFDKVYKLHEMWVWNSNQLIESFLGLGAKDVVIETSLDGNDWSALEETQFAQAAAQPDYLPNTILSLGNVLAKHVRITVNSGYGMMPQYGLSEVRFYFIPTYAREPEPANDTVSDTANVLLNWRVGREAVSHEVYFGTDAQNLSLLGTTTDNSLATGPLDYTQTYYWSVTEVNEAEMPASYAGDVWSFTTPAYGVVDDFDQYDNQCNRIFFAWEDGLGHNGGEEVEKCDVPASEGNGGGSIVGHAQTPFAEKSIVRVGSQQSMPLSYDNAFGASETQLTLEGQDWTTSGVQTLSLFFYGQPGNSGQLYVKINGAKVVNAGDVADLTQEQWQRWDIDLAGLNGLQNVTTLTIGVDGASAAGMLYIDDIRLYP